MRKLAIKILEKHGPLYGFIDYDLYTTRELWKIIFTPF